MADKSIHRVIGIFSIFMFIAFALVLSIPENQWNRAPGEMSQLRSWDGASFSVDDYDGQELGRKIGNWVIEKMDKN